MSAIYYTMFTTETTVEYHVNPDRKEVESGTSMSSQIARRGHSDPVGWLERCAADAKLYSCTPVTCTRKDCKPITIGDWDRSK